MHRMMISICEKLPLMHAFSTKAVASLVEFTSLKNDGWQMYLYIFFNLLTNFYLSHPCHTIGQTCMQSCVICNLHIKLHFTYLC